MWKLEIVYSSKISEIKKSCIEVKVFYWIALLRFSGNSPTLALLYLFSIFYICVSTIYLNWGPIPTVIGEFLHSCSVLHSPFFRKCLIWKLQHTWRTLQIKPHCYHWIIFECRLQITQPLNWDCKILKRCIDIQGKIVRRCK